MKKYLYILLAFVFSCSNSFEQKEAKLELLQSENQEKAFLGYDEDKVYDSSIIVKVALSSDKTLDQFVASLKDLNVVEKSREKAFVDKDMYLTLKALGNYPQTLAKLREIDGVIYAEPNYEIKVIDSCSERNPNDFLTPFDLSDGNLEKDPEGDINEYALEITGALRAYKDFGYGTNTVWAGIIDTGTNGNHEDLIYENGEHVVKILKTAFGGAYGDELVQDFTGNTDTEGDTGGHGTHCTGSICAVGNNNKGIAGVAWKNMKFVSYKALKDGRGNIKVIYGALRDLVDTVRKQVPKTVQATIPLNLSIGGDVASNYVLEQLNYALSNGVLPIAASGNEGKLLPSYPAAAPGVLAVGASTDNEKKVHFSTTGSWLNVVAPGFNIVSLGHLPQKKYVSMSGTSMATPFVTGIVCYLLSFDPTLTPSQIIAILEKTADKIDLTNTDPMAKYDKNGFSLWYGHGRVNVYEAVKMIKENRIPAKGEEYVETTLKVNTPFPNYTIHVYEKNTGVLVCMTIPYNKKPSYAEIRGLRAGTYNVVCGQNMKEVTIGNEEDVVVKF